MINRNQNRAIKPSFVPKFSDPDIYMEAPFFARKKSGLDILKSHCAFKNGNVYFACQVGF